MRYLTVGEGEGSCVFAAAGGEAMVARPRDAIVRNLANPGDTYRAAAGSFACTYEIIEPARML